MSNPKDTAGPIVVWHDYGCEGWSPTSHMTLVDAIHAGIERGDVITMVIGLHAHVIEPPPFAAVPATPKEPQ